MSSLAKKQNSPALPGVCVELLKRSKTCTSVTTAAYFDFIHLELHLELACLFVCLLEILLSILHFVSILAGGHSL